MSNVEHYFENMLFEGHDEVNKKTMTPKEIDAVDTCVDYILHTIFSGRDDFKSFVRLRENKYRKD